MEWLQSFVASDAAVVTTGIMYVLGATGLGVGAIGGCTVWWVRRNGKK